MGETYQKEYSETDWADDFLTEAMRQLPKNADLPEFRGMLDKYNIQQNEAWDFLQAYKSGSLEKFLEQRGAGEKEKILKFPQGEPGPEKKAA
ncbi:MAG: hypothetical protein ABSA74_03050 [Candidatus Staskawiczbacteria bacterium]|jgi:hypothetical protein